MQSTQHPTSNEYLKNAVMTATPEQLQLMLYDGAIRFARQARDAMQAKDWETSCEKLIRAEKIVLQMQNGLRHDVNPELCEQLGSLYQFIYSRLVDANITHRESAIDEALSILEHQRETWRLLLEKLQEAPEAIEKKTISPQRPAEADPLCLQA